MEKNFILLIALTGFVMLASLDNSFENVVANDWNNTQTTWCSQGSQTSCSTLTPERNPNNPDQFRGRVSARTDTHHGVSAQVHRFGLFGYSSVAVSGSWMSSASNSNSVTAHSNWLTTRGATTFTQGQSSLGR